MGRGMGRGGRGRSVDRGVYRKFTGGLYGFIGKVYRPQLLCGMLCGPFIGDWGVYRLSGVGGGVDRTFVLLLE